MTNPTRRNLLELAAAAGLMPLGLGAAKAATYPEKPVRLIVPIAAGGQTDVVARLLQSAIDRQKLLPQPLVVVNNAAAGGSIGTRMVRDAAPDGYTIGLFHMGLLTAPAVGVVDYDHTAFEMIGQVGRTQVGMGCLDSSRFSSMKDVIAEAKAKPETITVAMNVGLLPHFVPLMFAEKAGISFRFVQAGGGAVRLKSILGKHTDLALFANSEFHLYKSQGIRPLVMFSEERVPELPDVPTAREIGVDTVFEERVIAFAPKGTPKPQLETLGKALEAATRDPEVLERFKGLGVDGVYIDGPTLATTLDKLAGPIRKVGALVTNARKDETKN
jgi:tripartite-type tricarboxylate transporter receptor subunit TctC